MKRNTLIMIILLLLFSFPLFYKDFAIKTCEINFIKDEIEKRNKDCENYFLNKKIEIENHNIILK